MTRPILLICDDAGTNQGLRRALLKTAPGWRMETTSTRPEVEAVPAPVVILLDLMLSRSPAFEMLRWLRAEQTYRDTPVFVLGSNAVDREASRHAVNEAYALGANACLLKESSTEGFEPIARGIAAYASVLSNSSLSA